MFWRDGRKLMPRLNPNTQISFTFNTDASHIFNISTGILKLTFNHLEVKAKALEISENIKTSIAENFHLDTITSSYCHQKWNE